jgi:anti-sigma B factor antagonist
MISPTVTRSLHGCLADRHWTMRGVDPQAPGSWITGAVSGHSSLRPGRLASYGGRMHDSPAGDPPADLEARGPADEQVLRLDTSRVVNHQTPALVITVAGEIDQFTVNRLRTAVNAGFNELRGGEILVVDLTAVTFFGSPGLQALVDVTEAAKQRREPLRIVVDHNRPVIRPLQITGLGDVLALYDTVEQALQPPP